ncbi:MAG: hypothetical protein KTR31_00905 [Myxococcales bacterium]|nr:hypothetical protein [Myxococcales bacterium]
MLRVFSATVLLLTTGCVPGSAPDGDPDGTGDPTQQPTGNPTGPTGTGPGTGTNGQPPTWYQDIAPLVADRCGACHVTGGIGPFSIETYDEALTWGFAMDDAITSGRMPPVHISEDDCAMPAPIKDDVRLSDDEKAMFSAWVAADMPEGDPDNAAPAPLRVAGDLQDVDSELQLQEAFEIDGDRDIYQCFRVPLQLEQDVWLTGLQVIPDNEAVVHHVLVWNDPEDQSADQAGADGSYECTGFPDIFPTELVGAWTPGANPAIMPRNTGVPLKAGGSLVLNIHYHPTGTTRELDRSSIQLQWSTEQPKYEATFWLADLPFGAISQSGNFEIPAGAKAHKESHRLWLPGFLFPDEMAIFTVGPHMHYLGTEMKVTLDQGDKGEQCLVHSPNYRFDYQQGYFYDADVDDLPIFRRSDRIEVECTYDNSPSNPFLPLHMEARGTTEPTDVGWGEETGDEMCMAILGFVLKP